MTETAQQVPVAVRMGRPSKMAQIEKRLGMGIEHHVAIEMAKGRTTKQIAAALRICERTIRYHLHRRGYRINCDCKLVKMIDPLGQGEARRRA